MVNWIPQPPANARPLVLQDAPEHAELIPMDGAPPWVAETLRLKRAGRSTREISEATGASQTSVKRVLRGEYWVI